MSTSLTRRVLPPLSPLLCIIYNVPHFHDHNHFSSSSCSTTTTTTKPEEDNIIESTLRVDLLAQQAATSLAHGRALASNAHRPDLSYLSEIESHHLDRVKSLIPEHHVRPSLLNPLVAVAFTALGVVSTLAPSQRLSAAVAAGVQDALTDTFNEQLRDLHAANTTSTATADVRSVVKELRDQERAPEGAPQAPDILSSFTNLAPTTSSDSHHQHQRLTMAEGVAAVVKATTRVFLQAAKKI